MLTDKSDEIERLAEELLEKETLTLPDLLRILGERPYPLKETVKEYLEEMKERIEKDREEDAAAAAKEAEKTADGEEKEGSEEGGEDAAEVKVEQAEDKADEGAAKLGEKVVDASAVEDESSRKGEDEKK